MRLVEFEVIDNGTGREPNCELIAITEEWANNLMPYDIDSFAVTEDGRLVLIDDCGNCSFAPSDRFAVKFNPDSLRPKGRWLYVTGKGSYAEYECDECREHTCFDEKIDGSIPVYNFCPSCGADMREDKI